MAKKISVLDSTLRDGSQGENISFTNHDKINIVKKLDKLGIDYIEAGNPSSNPKDTEFFNEIKSLNLLHSKIVAFGSTRHKNVAVENDEGVKALLSAGTEAVSIFGKTSVDHVLNVLNTTKQENLQMIEDTVRFFKEHGKTVIFDAEHFFDGFKEDSEYALAALKTASRAGADIIALCDTNGGAFCDEISDAVKIAVGYITESEIGIHCHDDMGCAVANTITAIKVGATHIQGTYIGFGERCGNANLSSIIPTLQLKYDYDCIPHECIVRMTKTARYIAEVANISLNNSLPYVGKSAFAHKGGMHVDGIAKKKSSFEHVSPESVGNQRNILISEMAGRTAMMNVVHEIDSTITRDSKEAKELIELLKELEYKGYLFESATASLELLLTKQLGRFTPFFELLLFKVMGEHTRNMPGQLSSAMIKIQAGNEIEITAAEGEGPVHALDIALKKAVQRFYPSAKYIRLIDYKVRVIDSGDATAATVRVIVVSSNGTDIWTTVGVSRDIIDASLQALMDSIEYRLMKQASDF